MEFICDKSLFARAVSNVSKACSEKTNMPILEGILLEAKGNTLFLTCYDLHLAIKTSIPANITEEGSLVLGAPIIASIASKVVGKTIKFSTTKTEKSYIANVSSGRSKFKVIGMKAEDFPDLPNIKTANNFSASASDLIFALKYTIFSISSNTVKPILNGILFSLKDNVLDIVATDGFKLMKRIININGKDCSFVVPGNSCSQIIRIMEKTKVENVSISANNLHAIFKFDNYEITTRLIDGTFIDYKSIIPEKYQAEIVLNRNELIKTLDRTALVNIERLPKPLVCKISKDGIDTSILSTLGQSEDHCDIESFTGEDVTVGINDKFILAILSNIPEEKVKIGFVGPVGLITFRSIFNDNFFAFTLPIRLS